MCVCVAKLSEVRVGWMNVIPHVGRLQNIAEWKQWKGIFMANCLPINIHFIVIILVHKWATSAYVWLRAGITALTVVKAIRCEYDRSTLVSAEKLSWWTCWACFLSRAALNSNSHSDWLLAELAGCHQEMLSAGELRRCAAYSVIEIWRICLQSIAKAIHCTACTPKYHYFPFRKDVEGERKKVTSKRQAATSSIIFFSTWRKRFPRRTLDGRDVSCQQYNNHLTRWFPLLQFE